MSCSLLAGCLWVFASAVTAMLPVRRQYLPGIMLLVLGPVLIGWLAYEHGIWIALLSVFAFASIFRKPLTYIAQKGLGMLVGPRTSALIASGDAR